MKPVEPELKYQNAQPFLRWAGGKRQLLPALRAALPVDVQTRAYFEPFLGAGSLFFAVRPRKAILGDANASLIATYSQLRDHPMTVLNELRLLMNRHSAENYYQVRREYNTGRPSSRQAARFIYLNKTCFNGIFRVNLKGEFNVPKGSKDKLALPSQDDFLAVATALDGSILCPSDYKKTLSTARKGDFVYLDPPYPALNGTAYFTHYTSNRFGFDAQNDLAVTVKKLHNRGVHFLMSNANTPLMRELYSEFSQEAVPVRRYVSCKEDRTHVSELLIKNY